MNILLSEEKSLLLLNRISSRGIAYSYDPEKHKIQILNKEGDDKDKSGIFFRLPIQLEAPPHSSQKKNPNLQYVILMIQSGQAAIGYFEGDKNLDHKVFRSYMVRKKQGKSQIKYLNSKGKSRAGSRVRLANTIDFFENINERLQDYFRESKIDRIALSCSKTLIPYLFNSKVPTPFEKGDERILKIPKHIPSPSYEQLLEAQKFLRKGELIFEEEDKAFITSLLE